MIYQLNNLVPSIHHDAYITDNATVIGDVHIGAGSSVWFNTVIRGENDTIVVGENSNIQDACVLHVDPGFPLTLGDGVSVGHMAMIHGCTVDAGALVGIGSVVLNGAHIGADSLIGAKSLITEGKVIPPRSLVMGAPGNVIRELTDEEVAGIHRIAETYANRARDYRANLRAVQPT